MRDFVCPLDCLPGVGEVWSGEYDFDGLETSGSPIILDIGANCGAFSLRALKEWPEASVVAYEPNPDLFSYLTRNIAPRVHCINAAVGNPAMNRLFAGKGTRLCGSQYASHETDSESLAIEVVAPQSLPVCDVLKIDAEGAEAYIIEHLQFVPSLLAFEWHSENNRIRIDDALKDRMRMVSCKILGVGRGVSQYIKL